MMEAIAWVPLKVPNNQDYIDLVDDKTTGILACLDSACQQPKGTTTATITSTTSTFTILSIDKPHNYYFSAY